MDSIEAHRVKTVPGNPLIMRRAEEETANQCSNTKESTGAPVSASEQDSHSLERVRSLRVLLGSARAQIILFLKAV